MAILKDVGIVTAYGYAKENGYEGTESEYGQLMADFASAAAQAVAAKNDAIQAKEDAEEALSDIAHTIANHYPTDTASGSIASFSDGADNVEIKSAVVQIGPVQDLHGYDHPWPAGGGVNKIPLFESKTVNGVTLTNNNGEITLNGTATADAYFEVDVNILVPNGSTFYLCCFNPVATDSRVSLFAISDNGNPQKNMNVVNGMTTATATADMTISKFRLRAPVGVTLTNFKCSPMLQIGGTAPTVFSPYSNICPISGWTGAKILHSKDSVAYLVSATYNSSVSKEAFLSHIYFPWGCTATKAGLLAAPSASFDPNTDTLDYNTATQHTSDSTNPWYVKLASASAISQVNDVTYGDDKRVNYTWTKSSVNQGDVWYVRPYGEYTIDGNAIMFYGEMCKITVGTNYEGNTDDIIPLTFPATVYGGTQTYEGDGVWTVESDWARISITDYLANINNNGTRNSNQLVALSIPGKKPGVNNFTSNLFAITPAEIGKYTMHGRVATATVEFEIPLSALGVTEEDPVNVRLSASKQWLTNNPTQLCYELATPQTYTLTTEQVVNTILGQNNIWADCGDISVEYRADIALYIDKLTGSTEDDMVADSNIPANTYFLIGNTLFKSTAAIEQGATIVPGTNCMKTDLAAALNTLNA